MNYQNSNYQILENIKSGIGEWNSVIGSNMANSLIVGYTSQDESRATRGRALPVRRHPRRRHTTYTVVRLRAVHAQQRAALQDVPAAGQLHQVHQQAHADVRRHASNATNPRTCSSPASQSAYVYNSLDDFYTDANGYLANPNRTISPVNLRRFQVRYSNIPARRSRSSRSTCWYAGGYAQDEWRAARQPEADARPALRRARRSRTPAYANANADALTFRDENGQPVQYSTGKLPDANILWSPRVGLQLERGRGEQPDAGARRHRPLHRPSGLCVDLEPDRQHRRADRLRADRRQHLSTGRSTRTRTPTSRPTSPARRRRSYELASPTADFKFPQVWRSNIAVDRRLPWGITGTAEFLYNKDVNGIYYINANLPAAQASFAGVGQPPALDQQPHPLARCTTPSSSRTRTWADSWNLAFSGEQELPAAASSRPPTATANPRTRSTRLDRVRFVERQSAPR